MRGEFTGLLLLLVIAVGFPLALRAASHRLSPGTSKPASVGSRAVGRMLLPASFTLASMLFLLALVELVFVLAWAALARGLGGDGLLAIGVFTTPVLVGVVYAWRKRSFEH